MKVDKVFAQPILKVRYLQNMNIMNSCFTLKILKIRQAIYDFVRQGHTIWIDFSYKTNPNHILEVLSKRKASE